MRHVANSDALLRDTEWQADAVRVGILLYGYSSAHPRQRLPTRPFLHWKTRLLLVKRVPSGFPVGYGGTYRTPCETCLGTIDVGYADGYARACGNRAFVLVKGRRVPVVGRVSMNLTTLDLGPASDAVEGDEVVLLGQQGAEAVWADDIAEWVGTIPYEILTGIRSVPLA